MDGLVYKIALKEDFEDFYRIKCDEQNVKWSGFADLPQKHFLYQWYLEQLFSEKRRIYLVYKDGICCAFFYLDRIDDTTYELSASGVLSTFTMKGIGTELVRIRIAMVYSLGGKRCIAWIAENNISSYKRFEKLGFIRTDDFEVRNIPLLGGQYKFYKWIKLLD